MRTTYDIRNEESYGKYLRRKQPLIHKALYRIKGVREVCEDLFDNASIQWSDESDDLMNKVLVGLLKLELEDHLKMHQGIEEKVKLVKENGNEWHFIGYEGDTLVLMNNCHQSAKVPRSLFVALRMKQKIDVTIHENGDSVHYLKGKVTVATIPKSLLLQLTEDNIKNLPEDLERSRGG